MTLELFVCIQRLYSLQLLNFSLILLNSQSGSVSSSTWIKENYGFQAGIFIVVYLKLLEGKHQLIQDSHGYPAHLQLRAVSGNNVVIPCRRFTF